MQQEDRELKFSQRVRGIKRDKKNRSLLIMQVMALIGNKAITICANRNSSVIRAFRATLFSRDYATLNSAHHHQGAAAHQSHGCLLRTTDPVHFNPSLTRQRQIDRWCACATAAGFSRPARRALQRVRQGTGVYGIDNALERDSARGRHLVACAKERYSATHDRC